jgi:hypothetical protein
MVGVATVDTIGTLTVRVKDVVFVTPPPVALTVIVELPAGVEALVAMLRVEEQVGLQELAENEPVAPDGNPDTVNDAG